MTGKIDKQVRKLVGTAVKEAGSLNSLAYHAGVSQSSLSRWLNGDRDITWNVLARLLDYVEARISLRK